MPRYLLKYLTYFSIIICFVACQSTQKLPSHEIKKDGIGELIFEIKQNIVPKYYDYETKKIIRINLKNINSNYDEEPLFDKYIYSKISQEFKAANQLDLEPYPDSTYDVTATLTIVKESNGNLKFLSSYLDSNTQKILYANQHIYKISDFDLMDFGNFKNSYTPIDSEKEKSVAMHQSFVSVSLFTEGDSYKAEDKYYLETHRGVWGATDYIIKEDTGLSGHYPLNIKCKINNKTYYPHDNETFYKGNIPPGTLNFVASFQGGFWDGYKNRERVLTDEYSKNFKVRVPPNDNIKIDILCAYNGKQSVIKVKVYRIKKVFVEGIIQEEAEIIEIY